MVPGCSTSTPTHGRSRRTWSTYLSRNACSLCMHGPGACKAAKAVSSRQLSSGATAPVQQPRPPACLPACAAGFQRHQPPHRQLRQLGADGEGRGARDPMGLLGGERSQQLQHPHRQVFGRRCPGGGAALPRGAPRYLGGHAGHAMPCKHARRQWGMMGRAHAPRPRTGQS